MRNKENEISYEPGDHLLIVPVNRSKLVNKVLAAVTDVVNQNDYLLLEDKITMNESNIL